MDLDSALRSVASVSGRAPSPRGVVLLRSRAYARMQSSSVVRWAIYRCPKSPSEPTLSQRTNIRFHVQTRGVFFDNLSKPTGRRPKPGSFDQVEAAMTVAFHPDLARVARVLPHGVGTQPWRGILKVVFPVLCGGLGGFPRERAKIAEGVEVFFARAGDGPRPTLFWVHGGGYIFGDARMDGGFLQQFVTGLKMNVVSVQYRFAEKHPFPTPLDDCMRAYAWTVEQDFVEASSIVVAGNSAGGGLAAALCQRIAREGPKQQPLAQILIAPMLDDRSSDSASVPDEALRIWNRKSNRYGWGCYLAGHDRDAPPDFAVPARAEKLGKLPPAWIGVGTLDLFHEENRAYAERLRAAGSAVELHAVEGGFHAFSDFAAGAPVSRDFNDAMMGFLRGVLRAPRAL